MDTGAPARCLVRGRLPGELAFANLFWLLPGSAVYLYCEAKGWVPTIPGYGYRVAPLLVAAALSGMLLLGWRRLTVPVLAAFACLGYVAAITFAAVRELPPGMVDATGQGVAAFQLKAVANYFLYFVTGLCVLGVLCRHRQILVLSFAALAFLLACNVHWAGLSIDLVGTGTRRGVYLFIADAFALWALLAMGSAGMRRKNLASVLLLVVGAGVFATGSRAAFAALLMAAIPLMFVVSWTRLVAVAALLGLFCLANAGRLPELRIVRSLFLGNSDDVGYWQVGHGVGKLHFAKAMVDGQDVISFAGGIGDGYFVYRPPGVGSDDITISWGMRGFKDYRVIVACDTEKGSRSLVYLPSLPPPANAKAFFITLPKASADTWVEVSRDVGADLRLAGWQGRLRGVLSFSVRGTGFMIPPEFRVDGEEASGLDALFLLRHGKRAALQREQLAALSPSDLWLGDFCGQLGVKGRLGDYVHNYLSFWLQYGLIPFLLFAGLFLGQYALVARGFYRDARRNLVIELRLWRARRRFGKRKGRAQRYGRLKTDDPALLFTFLLATFNLVEIVFARSYATPYVWLSLGMMPAYLMSRKKGSVEGENHTGGGGSPELHEDRAHPEGVRQA